ncbi:MAG: hypothetical protein RR460_04320 [Clostridium sp.]
MGNNSQINLTVEIKKAVNESGQVLADQAAKKVIDELRNNNMLKKEMSYYKRVELLLYNYENLKDAVKQKQEDIDYIKENGLPESSKSIVVYSSAGGSTKQDRYLELIEKYERDTVEIERDIRRIDNALDKIKADRYYSIIKLKYLSSEEDKVTTDEQLAEQFDKERITIIRNRKRLINKLITILFPESIRDVI